MSAPTNRQPDVGTTAPPRPVVTIGDGVAVGGSRLLVIGPPGTGADATHVTFDEHRARGNDERGAGPLGRYGADGQQAAAAQVPLLVELRGATELAGVAGSVGAVVVDGDGPADRRLAAEAAASGLPAVLRLPAGGGVTEWLAVLDAVGDCDGHLVLLVPPEPRALIELARRAGRPVIADIGDTPELAGPAVAGGADGVWLSTTTAAGVGQAREAMTRLAPLVRQARPETLAECRDAIDAVDAVLATLLEHRVSLAGRIQRLKPVGGHAGRERHREAAIVQGMANRAPSLSIQHLERIVGEIIAAGLDVAERDLLDGLPAWRL